MNNDHISMKEKIGGYGKVPVETIWNLGELLDEMAIENPELRFKAGKTALFWAIVHTIDNHLEKR